MEAKELVGKLAMRTERTKSEDHSYVDSPLKILKVTEHHIVASHEGTSDENIFGDDIHILDSSWLDDKWIDYKELVKGCEPALIGRIKKRAKKKLSK